MLQENAAPGSFLYNPLPLHGASISMISKKSGILLKCDGSLLDTMPFALPHLVIFWVKTGTRVLITSLLSKRDCGEIRDWINVDLPPGAAHKSRTFNFCPRSAICFNAYETNIPDASCT